MCAAIIVDNIFILQREKSDKVEYADKKRTATALAEIFVLFELSADDTLSKENFMTDIESPEIRKALGALGITISKPMTAYRFWDVSDRFLFWLFKQLDQSLL